MTPYRERGGGGAPPPRTPPRHRREAVLVLSLVAAALVVVTAAGRTRPATLREPPFDLSRPDVEVRSPALFLYVTATCRWCQAELHAWDSLLALGGRDTPVPTVIMGPGAPADWRERLPGRLAPTAHLDADGALGRGLGVGAVPFRARVVPPGQVVEVGAGLSSPMQRRALLTMLSETANPSVEVR